jgi:hypothetical protein
VPGAAVHRPGRIGDVRRRLGAASALGVDDVVIKGMNMHEMLSRKVAEMLGEPLPQDVYRR